MEMGHKMPFIKMNKFSLYLYTDIKMEIFIPFQKMDIFLILEMKKALDSI